MPTARNPTPTDTTTFGPMRLYSGPAANDVIAKALISGSSPTPESSAENLSAFSMNWGRYSSAEKNIADMSSTVTHAAEKTLLRTTSAGTSAMLPWRGSVTNNAASSASPPANRLMMSGRPNPPSGLRSSASSPATIPADSSAIPG